MEASQKVFDKAMVHAPGEKSSSSNTNSFMIFPKSEHKRG
jgi:hypothetical protein